jgi:conjugative relaxase-like TrwC/TraI family protein
VLRVITLRGDGRYYTREPEGATTDGPPGPLDRSPYADAPGRWLRGPDAAPRPLTERSLSWLLSGRDPEGGRALPGRPSAVTGYDLTFSAAKSVSVPLGLSDPAVAARVRAAHEGAVAAAVRYLRARAVVARRRLGDDRTSLRARLGDVALFTHTTSRALDPHLHSHVVAANRAHGVDGRWSALDAGALRAHARAAGALYAAQLRHGLAGQLGVEWRPSGPVGSGRFEIVGLDPVLLAAFSGRRAEILAAQGGAHPTRRARGAWAATREVKQRLGGEALRDRWWARAGGLGVDEHEVVAALDRARGRPPRLDEYRFAASLHSVGDGPARRHVVQAWCEALATGAPSADVVRCVDRLMPDDGDRLPEPRHRMAELVPANAVLRALGSRPTAPAPLDRWLAASHRHDPTPLGDRVARPALDAGAGAVRVLVAPPWGAAPPGHRRRPSPAERWLDGAGRDPGRSR